MKYSRNKINNAGKTLISTSDSTLYQSALNIINEWRELHLPALDSLQKELMPIIGKEKVAFISRRLKRMSSITYKLDLNPNMGLGGMQDIGGLRIVVEDIETLEQVQEILQNNIPKSFILYKTDDYVINPKQSGYRALHFVYKYQSEDNLVDGALVELQVRTQLQHIWAMAVETAGLVTETPLKAGLGADNWLEFFKIVASIFALKEHCPVLEEHRGAQMRDLALQLSKAESMYKHIDMLKALKVSIIKAKEKNYTDGYYILNIDFKTRIVHISAYSKEKDREASHEYYSLEMNQDGNAVVMVSVPEMIELQEAYPSYFLDTEKFISIMDRILNWYNCKKQ